VADNKYGFEKRSITNVAAGANPNGLFFGNQGHWCKDASACNTEVARIINNVPDIQKFSTNDLDACSFCPPRSFNRSGYTVTNEFGVSVNTGTANSAINAISYQMDGTNAEHITLDPGTFYNISHAVPQPGTYNTALPYDQEHCLIIPAIGTSDQFYILSYTAVLNYYAQIPSDSYVETQFIFLGQAAKFTAVPVPYVTDGFIFVDYNSGRILKIDYFSIEPDNYFARYGVTPTMPGRVVDTLIDKPTIFSDEYNKCIFIMKPSSQTSFFDRAGSLNPKQRPVVRYIIKPNGSKFLFNSYFDINAPLGVTAVTPYRYNILYTASSTTNALGNPTNQILEWQPSHRTISLPDFWTFVNNPI
jgi:hypothetical protein